MSASSVELVKRSELHSFLIGQCPALHSSYNAPLWLQASPVLHSVLAQKCHSPHAKVPPLSREHISVPSGGTVAIDWLGTLPSTPRAIVVGFPGTGNCHFQTGLVPTLLCALHETLGDELAFGVAVYQGLGGLDLTSHKLPGSGYCATDDVGSVLKAARAKFPQPLPLVVVVAASFGTALFSNFAARRASEIEELGVSGALFLGFGHSVLETVTGSDQLAIGPFGTVRGLTSKFPIKTWIKHLTKDEGKWLAALKERSPDLDCEALLRSTTMFEWDRATLPAYGFDSIDALYDAADPVRCLGKMPMPTLFVNAKDDPLCPAGRLQGSEYERPHFAIVSTKHGGHIGWFERAPCGKSHVASHSPWLLNLTREFIEAIPKFPKLYGSSVQRA